ncbi:unnamed protein product [Cyprideis torosa]|uniref:indole-3-glycerol-phosphate synthase n=1 Tax=Cyprideis torosa TaxID=163714 RepID=A0A7R8WT27_9CRUS|nr:unnamed protein product [Cyprideis torosa]CAG0908121.1 unnamed protein product [Cyprideis torosa]
MRSILSGEKGPKRDMVLLNSGAAFMTAGLCDTIGDGMAIAADIIDGGKALEKLDALVALTKQLADELDGSCAPTNKIVARKKEEISQVLQDGVVLPSSCQEEDIAPPRGFREALLQHEGVSIIAEAKKASPSKGLISSDFDIVAIAEHYERCGAQAMSVLTDVDFFQGSLENLVRARAASCLPVLRKDFIVHEIQIEQSFKHGADAILLIAALLEEQQIRDYFQYAKEMGMDVIAEVHDEYEAEKCLRAECDLIGINNRDLRDFTVDIQTTFRLARVIGHSTPLVSESGLASKNDIQMLQKHGITAALVGEALMRAGTEGKQLAIFRDE